MITNDPRRIFSGIGDLKIADSILHGMVLPFVAKVEFSAVALIFVFFFSSYLFVILYFLFSATSTNQPALMRVWSNRNDCIP